jgi:hypothetical protein
MGRGLSIKTKGK